MKNYELKHVEPSTYPGMSNGFVTCDLRVTDYDAKETRMETVTVPSLTTPNKDRAAWLADVYYVMSERTKNHRFIKNPTCTKAEWETPSYDVTQWYHDGYSTVLAIAKDESHSVAWRFTSDGIHRW